MSGRVVLLFFCALVASLIFIMLDGGAVDLAEGATIEVPGDYSTIQAAVQAASPRDTISIADGTYSEAVMVRKMVYIVGESSTYTIINSPADWCIRVQSNNVRVSNLKLRLANGAGLIIEANNVQVTNVFCAYNNVGILIDDCQRVRVTNSNCYLNTQEGIRLYSSDDCTFTNVTFRRNDVGLRIEGGDGNTFDGCDIVNNTEQGCIVTYHSVSGGVTDMTFVDSKVRRNGYDGFSIQYSTGVRFTNCTVFENEGTGVTSGNIRDVIATGCHVHNNSGLGFRFVNSSFGEDVLVENCIIEDNHQPSGGWSGIMFSNMENVTVANCTIRKSLRGISFYMSRHCVCTNNTIVGVMTSGGGVDATGVYVGYLSSPGSSRPSDISIIDTTISTVLLGIHIGDVVGVTIQNVTVTEFGKIGIHGDSSDFGRLPITLGHIVECRIDSGSIMAQAGIKVDASSHLVVEDCIVTNASSGMTLFMSGTSGNDVLDNTVTGGNDGMYVSCLDNVRVHNNTIRDMNGFGMSVSGQRTSKIDVTDNVILRTSLTVSSWGLRVYNVGGSTIENNLISETMTGLYMMGPYCVNNVVTKNVVRDCSKCAVVLEMDPGPNTFYLNNFVNSTDYIAIAQDNEVFDNGALGNYWGNYTQRYPNAKIVGKVWDTPYVVPGFTAQDNYPLAYPYDTVDPVADAGEDQRVLAGTSVQFDATGSTDDWGIINFTWSFTYDGLRVEIFGEEPTFTFLRIGTYDVTLTVKDGWDNSDMATMSVEVYDDQPPEADAGEDLTVDMREEFQLDGSRSSDNGLIVGWSWRVELPGGGRPLTFKGETVDLSLPDAGDHKVTLNVTDEAGNWALDRMVVHVIDIEPPMADAGPDEEIGQGDQLELNGSASDDNVGITNWKWRIEGGDVDPVDLEGETTVYVFTGIGEYTVTLNVTDAAGNWDTDEMVVTVTDTTPPEADAGEDQEVEPGTEVTMDGSGSSDNVAVVSWTWALDDDGTVTFDGEVATYTFENQGRFVVTLTVADAAGNTDTDEVVVIVGDGTPPVADAGKDQEVDQGTEVTLDGGGSTDNVAVVSWSWTFQEDGRTVTLEGERPRHTFELAGEFEITLEVSDGAGNSGTDTVTVTVRDTEPPVADAGEDITTDEGEEVDLDGSGSTDNVGIESYVWTFEYEGSTESLEGMVSRFTFEVGGSYEVTLTVADEAGNEDSDTVTLRVFGAQRPWRLGPFADKEGNAIDGVRVEVRLNGTRYRDDTDDEGYIELSVLAEDLVSPATVKATKEGWKDLEFEMPLDDLGDPDGDIPPMEREEGEEPGISLIWPFLLTVAIVIVVLFIVFNRMNRVPEEAPEEAPKDDLPDEDMSGGGLSEEDLPEGPS